MPADFIPYCGIPPVPATLKWNLDPVVLTTFAGVGALYYFIAHKKVRPCSQVLFGIGWLISATALISPLCNLSVALFSARVGQHLLLTLIAAPLIVLGFAKKVVLPERNNAACSSLIKIKFVGSTVLFAMCMWVWHWPGPYDETLQNNYIYWLMHITTFGSALWLWQALLNSRLQDAGSALVAGFITAMQMSLLGALLTFANHPLFIVHVGTTEAWHFSQIEDQQFGGLVMWVVGGLLLTAYAVGAFALLLHRSEENTRKVHAIAVTPGSPAPGAVRKIIRKYSLEENAQGKFM